VGRDTPRLDVIELDDDDRTGEEHVDDGRVRHQIPIICGLVAQLLECASRKDFTKMTTKAFGMAQVRHKDRRHGVSVQGCEVVALEECVDDQLPVQRQIESMPLPVLMIAELESLDLASDGPERGLWHGSVKARRDPDEAILLNYRKLAQSQARNREVRERFVV
jgi:hypothetical protein